MKCVSKGGSAFSCRSHPHLSSTAEKVKLHETLNAYTHYLHPSIKFKVLGSINFFVLPRMFLMSRWDDPDDFSTGKHLYSERGLKSTSFLQLIKLKAAIQADWAATFFGGFFAVSPHPSEYLGGEPSWISVLVLLLNLKNVLSLLAQLKEWLLIVLLTFGSLGRLEELEKKMLYLKNSKGREWKPKTLTDSASCVVEQITTLGSWSDSLGKCCSTSLSSKIKRLLFNSTVFRIDE